MSELLDLIRKILDDKQAENIKVLDMRGVNPFTDYFVICTAKNLRHANALADFAEEEALKNGYDIRSREGEKESTWILVDLYEVVIHIFTEEARNTYRLEALWADRPVIE